MRNFARSVLVAFCALIFGLAAVSVQAANYCVENADDVMTGVGAQCDAACDPGGPCSLRDALAAATANGDRIFFFENFFNTPRTITMVNDTLTLLAGIQIEGPGAGLLTIDAGIYDVVFLLNGLADSQISGMTLMGASKRAIELQNSNLALSQMVLQSNSLAIDCTGTSRLNITDSWLDNNGEAGAIVADCAAIQLSDSTFSNNFSLDGAGSSGGALWYQPLGSGELTATNVTFSGNQSNFQGGAIQLSDEMGSLNAEFNNVTIADNKANVANGGGSSGGLFADLTFNNSDLSLRNTLIGDNIVSGNTGNNPDCTLVGGNVASNGFNLVEDPSGCNGLSPDDITGEDPLLGSLGANGSGADPLTPTQALRLGSPAVDAGDPNGCLDANDAVLDLDQREVVRPLGGPAGGTPRCDIGAVENGLVDLVIKLDDNSTLKSQIFFSDTATLTGTIVNNGPDFAPGVQVTAILPQGLNLIESDVNGLECSQTGDNIVCPVGEVDTGKILAFTMTIETGSGSFNLPLQITTTGINTNPTTTLNITINSGSGGGGCSLQAMPLLGNAWWLLGLFASLLFWRFRIHR